MKSNIYRLSEQNDIKEVTKEELLEAIRIINKGKSPDIYNLTIEHIYAADSILNIILEMINQIFKTTSARGTDHPPFSNFLFTNLF